MDHSPTALFAVDSHYSIGHTHLVCEDYTRHGLDPVPHVLVADGCSSSDDSDMGARLLVLRASAMLESLLHTEDPRQHHWEVGRDLIRRCLLQVEALDLEPTALDSTLLLAYRRHDQLWVHCYGDGVLALQERGGGLRVIQVDYAHNAPFYLSYLANSERHDLYRRTVGDNALAITTFDPRGQPQVVHHPYDHPLVFSFAVDTVQALAIASDGVGSLVALPAQKRLSPWEIVAELLDFTLSQAGPTPDFTKRRLRDMLGDCARRNILNADDIGLGVFLRTSP